MAKKEEDTRGHQQAQEAGDVIEDTNDDCAAWADAGECEKNPAYMATGCPVSCAGKLPSLGEEEVKRELEQEADMAEGVTRKGSMGEGEDEVKGGFNEEDLSWHAKSKDEYADASGFPDGADPRTCEKVSDSVSSTWCKNNCASKPPVCPRNLCTCSVPDPNKVVDPADEQEACGPEVGIRCGQMVFDSGYATIHDPNEVPEEKRHAATGTLDPPKGANPYEAAAEKLEKAEADDKRKAEAQKRSEAGQESLGTGAAQSSTQQGQQHQGLLRSATAEEKVGDSGALTSAGKGDSAPLASPGEGGKQSNLSKLFARFCRVGPCLGDQS